MSTPADRIPLPGDRATNFVDSSGTPLDGSAAANKNVKSSLKLFDGPLAVLDKPLVGANILTYPQDLGSNNQYRYLMRMLIFKQNREVNPLPIIPPNSFDISKRAQQQGRLNTDLFNLESGAAAVVGIGASFIDTLKGVSSVLGAAGGKVEAAGAITSAGVGALQFSSALSFASDLDASGLLGNANAFDNVSTEPLSYINLYMPDGLNFVDRHDYDAVSVTDALGTAGAVATGSTTELTARLAEGATLGGVKLLGENITNLSLYNQGYALNPQLQVLFKGSKNREFVFTFKFIPRNADEAATIDSIIRTLRYHAAPNYQQSGTDGLEGIFGLGTGALGNSRYFLPPSQFEIEFWIMNQDNATPNTNLPRIAKCVLSNVDVNYAPSGQFSAYLDGRPAETQVQLTFTETVILTKPDIEAGY